MANLRYRGKFRRALYYLAINEGNVRERLKYAYRELNYLREDEVPVEIRQEWQSILKALTALGPSTSSTGTVLKNDLDNTLSKMRNGTGSKIALRIYRLAVDIYE